jgi:hypothetical protein
MFSMKQETGAGCQKGQGKFALDEARSRHGGQRQCLCALVIDGIESTGHLFFKLSC